MKAIIDTIGIKTSKDNTANGLEGIAIEVNNENISENTMICKVNLHKKYGEGTIENLSQYKEALTETLAEGGAINLEEMKLTRVDIAFDTNDYSFANSDDTKLLRLVYRLLIARSKGRGLRESLDPNDNKFKSLSETTTVFGLEIYDKKKESEGIHPYNTRFEFRYKRHLNKQIDDFDYYFKKTKEIISSMDNHLEHAEQKTIETLKKLMDEAKKDGTYENFTNFIKINSDLIFTDNILKGIFEYADLSGTYRNWLRKYRMVRPITLYKKADILRVKKALLKALRQYNK